MMLSGNIQIKAGEKLDTGKKWIDSSGVAHKIYQKTLALDGTTGAMPNATTKNVAHNETIGLSKYFKVVSLRADNGTTIKNETSAGVSVEINATNVVVTTTTDLSAYVRGVVIIEFCS